MENLLYTVIDKWSGVGSVIPTPLCHNRTMTSTNKKIKISDIVVRDDLYPRQVSGSNPVRIQQYAECIDLLPPIIVNQDNVLVDGFHRFTAHRKMEKKEIEVEVIKTTSDVEIKKEAAQRNATSGVQLSAADKKKFGTGIYKEESRGKNKDDRVKIKKELQRVFSVSRQTVDEWTRRTDKDDAAEATKVVEKLSKKEGLTQSAITKHPEFTEIYGENTTRSNISKILNKSEEEEEDVPNAKHGIWNNAEENTTQEYTEDHWEQWLYDYKTFKEKKNAVNHPGNSDERIVDDLLFYYTKKNDTLLDPFAGGGSSIDVCKMRGRKCLAYDIAPIVEREKEILQHDITTGLPKLTKKEWDNVKIVYLDPPYWKTALGFYGDEETNLANMGLDQFNEALGNVIKRFAKKLKKGSYIALLIAPTTNYPDRKTGKYYDHRRDINFELIEEIKKGKIEQVDFVYYRYETQQRTARDVNEAKKNKKRLFLRRDLVVWKVH